MPGYVHSKNKYIETRRDRIEKVTRQQNELVGAEWDKFVAEGGTDLHGINAVVLAERQAERFNRVMERAARFDVH